MDALAWAIAFILMIAIGGGGAVGCVALAERGKNRRFLESEKTKRQGMDNAWNLEQQKLELVREQGDLPQLGKVGQGITVDIP